MIEDLIKYQDWRTGKTDKSLDEIGLNPAKVTACIDWAINSLKVNQHSYYVKSDSDAIELAVKSVQFRSDGKNCRPYCYSSDLLEFAYKLRQEIK